MSQCKRKGNPYFALEGLSNIFTQLLRNNDSKHKSAFDRGIFNDVPNCEFIHYAQN